MSTIKTISPVNAKKKIWQNTDPKAKAYPFLVEGRTFVPFWDGTQYQLGPINDRLDEKKIKELVKTLRFNRKDGTVITEANPYNKYDDFFTHPLTKVKMGKDIRSFNLKNPIENLGWLIISGDVLTANTKVELAKNPRAQWVIEDEEKEAELKSNSRSEDIKVIKTFDALPMDKKRILLTCFGIKVDRSTSDAVVEDKLYEIITQNQTVSNNTKEQFLKLTSEKEGKLKIIYTVNKAYQYSVLRKKGTEIQFNGQTIASDLQDLIIKLELPENSSLYIKIEEAIKLKDIEKH